MNKLFCFKAFKSKISSIKYFSINNRQSLIKNNQIISNINNESKTNNSFLLLYSLLHAPFYIISFTTNIYFIDVDYIRMSLRSLTYIQAMISGINISFTITNTEEKFKNILEKINLEEIIQQEKIKIQRSIIYSVSPVFINFISVQLLLNSIFLTNEIILLSFIGFLFSNLISLYVINKGIHNSRAFYKTNFYFFLLNMLFLSLIFYYILINRQDDRNCLKRPFDLNRIENLLTKIDLEKEDNLILENDIYELFNNLSDKQHKMIEEIYTDTDE